MINCDFSLGDSLSELLELPIGKVCQSCYSQLWPSSQIDGIFGCSFGSSKLSVLFLKYDSKLIIIVEVLPVRSYRYV